MYRCEICDEVVGPRTPAATVIVETRPRVYPERKKANPRRKGRGDPTDDKGGSGFEIVREVRACASCAGRA